MTFGLCAGSDSIFCGGTNTSIGNNNSIGSWGISGNGVGMYFSYAPSSRTLNGCETYKLPTNMNGNHETVYDTCYLNTLPVFKDTAISTMKLLGEILIDRKANILNIMYGIYSGPVMDAIRSYAQEKDKFNGCEDSAKKASIERMQELYKNLLEHNKKMEAIRQQAEIRKHAEDRLNIGGWG